MNIYLDTSVLAPIYVPETFTEEILVYLSEITTKIYISRLTETELYSAIAMKLRTKKISKIQSVEVIDSFQEDLDTLVYEKAYISDEMFKKAINFLSSHKTNLRTLDALHLACAFVINANLVTADRDLAKAANRFNISFKLLTNHRIKD